MPANLENSAMDTGLEKVSFHSNSKEEKCQRMFNYSTIALISHASKVMLKILQAKLQQYMNWELSDVHARYKKSRETRDQITNICWIMEKAREFQKNIYFCFTNYVKTFDCVANNKLWKMLKEIGIKAILPVSCETCMQVKKEQLEPTRHETMNWFKIGKRVHQGYVLSPCLFNYYAEYIIRNSGLNDSQTGIKIARRNINSLRPADYTPLLVESKEELKSLLMRVKKEGERLA